MDYHYIEEFGKNWLLNYAVGDCLKFTNNRGSLKQPILITFSPNIIAQINQLIEQNVENGGTFIAEIIKEQHQIRLNIVDVDIEKNISICPSNEFKAKKYYYLNSLIKRGMGKLFFPIPFHTHPLFEKLDFLSNVQVSDGDKYVASEEMLSFGNQKVLLPQIIISQVAKNENFILVWGGGIADNDPFKWCSVAFGESLPDLWNWIKNSVKESDLAKIILAGIGTAWAISLIRKPGETIAGTLLVLLTLLGHPSIQHSVYHAKHGNKLICRLNKESYIVIP